MNREELRAAQGPLKERYRADADAARATLHACGTVNVSRQTCDVTANAHRGTITAGLHPMTGGCGDEACSGDLLLQSLVACSGVTAAAVSTSLGLDVETIRIEASGDLDFRGTLGVDRDTPSGFRSIHLKFSTDGRLNPEELERLIELTERFCVVLQTIRAAAPVTSEAA